MIRHYSFLSFVPKRQLPLWIVPIPLGQHSQRRFHDHNMSEIVLITHGPGRHILSNQNEELHQGDVLVIHPGFVHAYDQTAELELTNIIYDCRNLVMPVADCHTLFLFNSFFPSESDKVNCTARPILHLNAAELQSAQQQIENLQQELCSNTPGCGLKAWALFIEFLVFLCRLAAPQAQNRPHSDAIAATVDYLGQHYAENVDLGQLARQCCMSRSNFFIQFKKITGETPVQYLIKLRLMHARKLLLFSKLRIAEVAHQCGFADSNYFCRKFRELFDCSPLAFRKNG